MVIKKLGKWKISEDELQQKIQQALHLGSVEPEATAVKFSFNRKDRSISIELPGSVVLKFPASNIKELHRATDEEIEQGQLIARGTLLRWEKFNADYSVDGFTHGRFGTQEWMRELARRGGRSKSRAKAAAARSNGLRGGRPRRSVTLSSLFPTKLVTTAEVMTATQLNIVSVGNNPKISRGTSFKGSLEATTSTNRYVYF